MEVDLYGAFITGARLGMWCTGWLIGLSVSLGIVAGLVKFLSFIVSEIKRTIAEEEGEAYGKKNQRLR